MYIFYLKRQNAALPEVHWRTFGIRHDFYADIVHIKIRENSRAGLSARKRTCEVFYVLLRYRQTALQSFL